jgi:hypothetical protein
MPWCAAVLLPMAMMGCAQAADATPDAKAPAAAQAKANQPAAAQPAAAPAAKPLAAAQPAATQPTAGQVLGKGSWYMSTNTTPSNWSKTGMFYNKPWEDHFDVGDNTTLELYVKALTPHTIEVFNAKKLTIGMEVHPDATHPVEMGGVTLGNYVQLTDQNWTKVSIPLADFKGMNLHQIFFFLSLPQSLGSGDYSIGIDEIRFVGGTTPVLWYGDAHPNNPITTHGPGMEAHYVPTGGVDVDAAAAKK